MGRKRSVVINTVGLLLRVLVTAASVQDSIAGQTLIEKVTAEHPTIRKTWADRGHCQHFVEHAATPTPLASPSCPATGPPNAPWVG